MCNVLELPRSTFYRWLQRTEDLKEDIEEKVKDVCLRHRFRYGYRRVTATLRKMGLCVNHKKVLRIMRQNHILSKVRRKKKKYINGAEPMVAPHRLERQFDASRPNEKWFTDVTYLLFGERTLYLSTIMDAFNREIISCVISESQTLTLAMKTLKTSNERAKSKRCPSSLGSRKYLYSKRISSVRQKKTALSPACPGKEIAMIMPSWKASLVI